MPESNAPLRLARFLEAVGALLDRHPAEADRLRAGRRLLEDLVATDDWLPEPHGRWARERYTQHLLHRDPAGRFSLVSFVWGPGQATPIHDHTVWGLVGVLRGAELAQRFEADGTAQPTPLGPSERLGRGEVEAVSPTVGDVHQVRNALDDQVSVSIHLYGADIGTLKRSLFPVEGGRKPFVSGYANDPDAPPFTLLARAA